MKPALIAAALYACGIASAWGQQRAAAPEYPFVEVEKPLPPRANDFIKAMMISLLPPTYVDDDDWGGEKKIQSGLNVRMDGLKVKTSRRWKNVNHGTWKRIDATLIDPNQHCKLQISTLPQAENGGPRYRIRASLRIRVVGRQQQWNRGVKLVSVSADAFADVSVSADFEINSQLIKDKDGRRLRVMPVVEAAAVHVDGFHLNKLSRAKGSAVSEFGKIFESLVHRAVSRKNAKLVGKINGKITKKPERFEIPASLRAILGVSS